MILFKILSLLSRTCSDVAIFTVNKEINYKRVPIFVVNSFPVSEMAISFINFKVS